MAIIDLFQSIFFGVSLQKLATVDISIQKFPNVMPHYNPYALSICTWFLKNQGGKIKFDELDF